MAEMPRPRRGSTRQARMEFSDSAVGPQERTEGASLREGLLSTIPELPPHGFGNGLGYPGLSRIWQQGRVISITVARQEVFLR